MDGHEIEITAQRSQILSDPYNGFGRERKLLKNEIPPGEPAYGNGVFIIKMRLVIRWAASELHQKRG